MGSCFLSRLKPSAASSSSAAIFESDRRSGLSACRGPVRASYDQTSSSCWRARAGSPSGAGVGSELARPRCGDAEEWSKDHGRFKLCALVVEAHNHDGRVHISCMRPRSFGGYPPAHIG
jgi:hypothetical protein